MDTDPIAIALEHAREYAASRQPDDLIDGASGFTVDNLLVLIAAAAPPTQEDEIIDKLGDLA